MKLFVRVFAILTVICGISHSCKDYLDISDYFDDELKLDTVFAQKRYVEAYLWGAVSQFPDEGKVFYNPYTPGPYATDEAFTLADLNSYKGMTLVLGEVNASNIGSTPFKTWGNMYQVIRKCNTVLARVDEAGDWTSSSEKLSLLAYVRFFRAYAYYQILVDFGPPILLGDEVLKSNEDLSYYDRSRCLYDEAVEYICSELEEASKYLPMKQQTMNFGRPTKGAAYGLVARLRLIHASPMFNGGVVARTYFSNWVRKTDGKHYVQQSYDEKRWAVAAAAAKRVMDMTDGGNPFYKLYTVDADESTPALPKNVTSDPGYYNSYPTGAAGIDPFRSVSELHNGEAIASINPEYVWGRSSPAIAEMTQRAFPIQTGNWSEWCIPQKIIDAFRMIDGRTIYDSSTDYPYSESGFSTEGKTFSGYKLNSGVFNMYINREARFYANVGFSECYWTMSSTAESGKHDLTITYYYDSANGKSAAHNSGVYTITGYVNKKNIHSMDAHNGANARVMPKTFGIIRFAEILLSYAEALNNLTTAHSVQIGNETVSVSRDMEAMKNAFNRVRYRAGLPGLSDAELSNVKTMQALVEQERMIELMHENRRYYDVRRWGIYEDVESAPITGMNTDASKASYYQRVIVNSVRVGARVVNKRMAFLPIPKNEVRRMPSFDQNPGWGD